MVDIGESRYNICKGCEHFNNILKICNICNCFLPVKTKLKSSACPDNPPKWIAVNVVDEHKCGSCNH